MHPDAVAELVEAARADLASANDELEAARRHHRSVETVLESLLHLLPLPVAVVDADLRVCAQSAAADERWGPRVGRRLDEERGSGARPPPVDACRALLAEARPVVRSVGDVQLALVVEPGTAARYVVAWAEPDTG